MEQIHVVDGAVLAAEPWKEMRALEDFLGLDHELTKDRWAIS